MSPFSHSGKLLQQIKLQKSGRALPAELSTLHLTAVQAPPPTSVDSLIKDVSSQPRVFYGMTSFITWLVTGNDVYLIYHSFRILFFLLPHLASRSIFYSSIPLRAEMKEKWHRCCPASTPVPPAAPHAKPMGRFCIKTWSSHAVASGSKDLGLNLPPLLHSLVVTATSCNISKCGLGAL